MRETEDGLARRDVKLLDVHVAEVFVIEAGGGVVRRGRAERSAGRPARGAPGKGGKVRRHWIWDRRGWKAEHDKVKG